MNPAQAAVEDVFERHGRLLRQHRQFLEHLKQQTGVLLVTPNVLSVPLDQTETMLQDFARCRTAYAQVQRQVQANAPHVLGSPSSSSLPRTSKHDREQKVDPSGLFMTDTIPTPINELLRNSQEQSKPDNTNSKRRAPGEAFPDAREYTGRKKVRLSQGDARSNSSAQFHSYPSRDHSRTTALEITDADDDSFIREVQELHDAKETKRMKKEEKKRKRDSGGSDIASAPSVSIQLQGMSISKHDHRAPKRQKTGNDEGTGTNSTSARPGSRPHTKSSKPMPKSHSKHSGAKNGKRAKRHRV